MKESEEKKMPGSIKKVFARSALVLLSIVFALVIIETAIRLTRPQTMGRIEERDHFCVYDERIGWVHRPNAKGMMISWDFSTYVEINSRGLRDRVHDYSAGENTFRILVLGDSFVWGYGVDQNRRFTDLLEQKLLNCEVINMGCSGYGQDQELLLLETEGVKYEPDLILIAVHFASDIDNNSSSRAYGYNKPVFLHQNGNLVVTNVPVPEFGLGDRMNKWAKARSAIWNSLMSRRTGGRTLEDRFTNLLNGFGKDASSGEVLSNLQSEVLMTHLLKRMKSVSEDHHAAFLVVLIPNIKAGEQVIEPDERYGSVIASMREEEIPFVDLDEPFRTFFRDNPGELATFGSDRHWNETGHRLVSDTLSEFLTADSGVIGAGHGR